MKRFGVESREGFSVEYFLDTLHLPQENIIRVFDLNLYKLPDGDFLYTANEQGSSDIWVAQYTTENFTINFL